MLSKKEEEFAFSTDNILSGDEIDKIFRKLINICLKKIILYTNFLDEELDYLVLWVFLNKRTKISSLNREQQLRNSFSLTLTDKKNLKFKFLKNLELDKNVLVEFIKKFLRETASYKKEFEYLLKEDFTNENLLETVEKNIGCSRDNLYAIIRECETNIKYYEKIKEMIFGKYLKLCKTQSMVKQNNNYILDEDDFQGILLAVHKAIDKYNSKKGTLTSYIKLWIKHQKSSKKRKLKEEQKSEFMLDDNLDLETETGIEENIVRKEKISIINNICKTGDKYGIGRLSLNISEVLDNEILGQMKDQMKRENIDSQAYTLN